MRASAAPRPPRPRTVAPHLRRARASRRDRTTRPTARRAAPPSAPRTGARSPAAGSHNKGGGPATSAPSARRYAPRPPAPPAAASRYARSIAPTTHGIPVHQDERRLPRREAITARARHPRAHVPDDEHRQLEDRRPDAEHVGRPPRRRRAEAVPVLRDPVLVREVQIPIEHERRQVRVVVRGVRPRLVDRSLPAIAAHRERRRRRDDERRGDRARWPCLRAGTPVERASYAPSMSTGPSRAPRPVDHRRRRRTAVRTSRPGRAVTLRSAGAPIQPIERPRSASGRGTASAGAGSPASSDPPDRLRRLRLAAAGRKPTATSTNRDRSPSARRAGPRRAQVQREYVSPSSPRRC